MAKRGRGAAVLFGGLVDRFRLLGLLRLLSRLLGLLRRLIWRRRGSGAGADVLSRGRARPACEERGENDCTKS